MNKIHFFNAANFTAEEIDLSKKNIFFVGDNGSGKTTAIRAIHYYYNSDVKALGIDPNKEGFKDFYFKYDNSFIIYEFEDYFVLMYKRRGEIKKRFSKQKFNKKRVIINDEIAPLEEVIKYAKEAYNYMPQTHEEFKRIIYGMDRRHLDFKLTTIRNYNTFVNLYNKIFNVNKAVFDANSIKEIIFTTLDRIDAGEIKYEDFLSNIYQFRNYFIFYRTFKNQQANIEKLYSLKNDLITLREDLNNLIKKISYKKEIEEKELENLKNKLQNLKKRETKLKSLKIAVNNQGNEILNKIEKIIIELSQKIEEINNLKKIFTTEKIQKAKSRVAKKDDINSKYIDKKVILNELIKGIKSQVDEIEETIYKLKVEKRRLNEELREEEIRLKNDLDELYKERIEKEEEKFIKRENLIDDEIDKINREIEKLREKREKYQKELNDIALEYQRKEEKLKLLHENEITKIEKEIKELIYEKENLLDENHKLNRKLKKLKEEVEEEIERIEILYKKKFSKVNEEVNSYKSIIKTIPNSFKEFLIQNVEDWEEELYPVIDKKLLNMSIDELKPRIVSETVFGIELDKTNLDTIPTMKEAEEKIEKLNKLKISLNEEKNQKLKTLTDEFKQKEIEITSKIETNNLHIEKINELINQKKSKKYQKQKELQEKLDSLYNEKKEKEKLIKINISAVDTKIKNLLEKREDKRKEKKILKKEFEKIKKLFFKEKEREFKLKKQELIKKYEEKKLLKNKKIEELKHKKEKISKDERIAEIQKEINLLERELKEIEEAEIFLKEYENKKEFIEKLPIFKNQLIECKHRKKELNEKINTILNKFDLKFKILEKEIEELRKNIDVIKDGLRKVKNIVLTDEKMATNEFLSYLIDEYRKKDSEFREKRIAFKESASNIKTALERFAIEGLEVNFNLENLSKLIKEELEKVDELYIFKEKKFEVLNRMRLKEIKNLLSGLLEKRLDNFERSKEDFIAQIRRINKNLAKVDFGIVKNIKIEIEENKKSILKIFEEIKNDIIDLLTVLNEKSLFFDSFQNEKLLKKIENQFYKIKKEINKESFSLIDVVDINIKFTENEKENTLKVIKNESSTGGSILLKIAIAVSLLELFLKEKADLFLILDEVSVLSTKNQKLLKDFVNEKGLGVIYVTPDLPPLGDIEGIDIYKFRNVNGEFEIIKLIAKEGIKIKR